VVSTRGTAHVELKYEGPGCWRRRGRCYDQSGGRRGRGCLGGI
jgi:hypothetical protein